MQIEVSDETLQRARLVLMADAEVEIDDPEQLIETAIEMYRESIHNRQKTENRELKGRILAAQEMLKMAQRVKTGSHTSAMLQSQKIRKRLSQDIHELEQRQQIAGILSGMEEGRKRRSQLPDRQMNNRT